MHEVKMRHDQEKYPFNLNKERAKGLKESIKKIQGGGNIAQSIILIRWVMDVKMFFISGENSTKLF